MSEITPRYIEWPQSVGTKYSKHRIVTNPKINKICNPTK